LAKEPDRYLKFNDATVTDISADEVFADTTGQTNNPYWLSTFFGSWRIRAELVFFAAYVHKDALELVESVHRQI
jgi:hypothetical protein